MCSANHSEQIVARVLLSGCSCVEPLAPWRWRCVVGNGSRVAVDASLGEGLLHLACRLNAAPARSLPLHEALGINRSMPAGARIVLDAATGALFLRADLAVVEESRLAAAFAAAVAAFHQGACLVNAVDRPAKTHCAAPPAVSPRCDISHLRSESSWQFQERGPAEWSVELAAESAPPAILREDRGELALSLELLRFGGASDASHRAIAAYLLAATASLCMVRAWSDSTESSQLRGFAVSLSAPPLPEEFEHAMGALSVAWQLCARETAILLDEAAAQSYLAAMNLTVNQPSHNKEE